MSTFKRVVLESPFKGKDAWEELLHEDYARLAMHDCLVNHGEAPFASHLLYTQPHVLVDGIAEERKLGIAAGLAWGGAADAAVVYVDLGVTSGMTQGIDTHQARGVPVIFRVLPGDLRILFRARKEAVDAMKALCDEPLEESA